MTDQLVPEAWEELRAMMQLACGPTVIVGGALRDLDNGRPVKDLDLFVLVPPLLRGDGFDPRFYEREMRRTVPGLEVVQQLQTSYAAFRDEVFHVTTCRVPGLPEVQVIFAALDDPEEAIERVDFGLCQIGWDGKELTRTAAYLHDQRRSCFTLLNCPSEHHRQRSIRRHDRFSAKYIGWPLIDASLVTF